MDKIALIKAEIERLYNDKSYSEDRWDMGYDCACEDIMSFLSTLESEEPDKSLEEKTCKGFEEEFRRFIKKEKEKEPDKSLPYYGDYGIYRVARHFAQWGANHTPLPEDTVLFQKGVEEGRRLEREDIMKDAVEKTVGQLERQWGGNIHFMHGFEVDEMDFPFLNSQECGYGDKVRIIVKEEKNGQSD